jgi:hypothetical protein
MNRHDDLTRVAAGETGWYDEHGQPAPLPDDFFHENSGWHPAGSEDPSRSEPF